MSIWLREQKINLKFFLFGHQQEIVEEKKGRKRTK